MARVLVGGFLRSGTTLVQNVLCGGAGVHPMVGEVLPLRGHVQGLARTLAFWEEHSRDYFDDKADAVRFFGGQIGAFLDRTQARFGSEHLVLKHPQLTPHFPLLAAAVPELRFVVVVRDPRDVVASALEARARGADEFERMPPREIAALWADYHQRALRTEPPEYAERLHVLRYEDLVRSPGPVVQRMAAAVGIDLSGFDPRAAPSPEQQGPDRRRRALHSPLYGQALTPKRVGRWRQVLGPDQVAEVEAVTGGLRGAFGYS